MKDKKRVFIGFAALSAVLGALAVAVYKLFPKMKQWGGAIREKCCPPKGKKQQ